MSSASEAPVRRALAVCKTCQAIFESPIGIGGSGVVIENVEVGPCPCCGGVGIIPDSVNDPLWTIITNPAHWEMIQGAISHIARIANEGKPAKQIQKVIESRYPYFQALGQLFAKDFKKAMVVLGMIAAACKSCSPEKHDAPQVQIIINNEARHVLEDTAKHLQDDQPAPHVPK